MLYNRSDRAVIISLFFFYALYRNGTRDKIMVCSFATRSWYVVRELRREHRRGKTRVRQASCVFSVWRLVHNVLSKYVF